MTHDLETLAEGGFPLLENVQAVAVGHTLGLSLTALVSASLQTRPGSRLWHDRAVPPWLGDAPGPVEPCVPLPEAAVVSPLEPCVLPLEPCVPHLEPAVVSPLHAGLRLDVACPSAYL